MPKFNDKQRKRIIADYVECGNYAAVARKYGVSATAIKKIVAKDNTSCELLRRKKEENIKSVVEHLKNKSDKACELIDTYLDALLDTDKIARSSTRELATALGIVVDKFTDRVNNGTNGTPNGTEGTRHTIIAHIDTSMSDDEITKMLKGEKDNEKTDVN